MVRPDLHAPSKPCGGLRRPHGLVPTLQKGVTP